MASIIECEALSTAFKRDATAPYAGDVSPQAAWSVLMVDATAQLVDVRTRPEWQLVGTPDLRSIEKEPLFAAWRLYPDMAYNGHFMQEISGRIRDKSAPLFFLCKSGGRSYEAANAMALEGYTRCYNVGGGFEGELDENARRGAVSGWKAEGLPWQQI